MTTDRPDAAPAPTRVWGGPRLVLAAALAALAAVGGCRGILDVDNPNNVPEAALEDAAAAQQQANGVEASMARMLAGMTAPYATATDELDWIGSRESWNDFEIGAIPNYLNEFTDVEFTFVGEARYLGDEAIKRLERFHAEGELQTPASLARAYLYTAVVYGTIADMFDDFAFSTKRDPAPPVGRANMVQLYDKAIEYLDKALPIARAEEDAALEYRVLAVRARTKHARAVWRLITPKGTVPANPLVDDAGAVQDAADALALGSGPDDRYRVFVSQQITNTMAIHLFFEVNGRNEMQVGHAFRTVDDDGNVTFLIDDPITGADDPAAARLITEFTDSPNSESEGFITIVSDRELNLIVAEAALARGDAAEFAARVNAVRALDGLPAYAGQIPPLDMLKHERRVNLFLQNRRLADLYRFNEKVAEWAPSPNFESAFDTPGLLFPVPLIERAANCFFANPPCASAGS